jgi:dinuclear metal center YbgI/SA1388 family protein
MTVEELAAAVDRLAPVALAEEWDNVGLMVGRSGREVSGVLVALELRDAVLREAEARGCEAILVHHPPIFPSVSALTDRAPGAPVLEAAERRIAVIAAHTNLDSAAGGLNDLMADDLGLADARPLTPHAERPAEGLGRVGSLEAPAALSDLVERAGAAYGAGGVVFSGDTDAQVATVACCTGSGAGLIDAARDAGADVFITCDLKYHDADRAGDLPLVGLQHAVVEVRAMRRWSARLADALAPDGVHVEYAEAGTDPWHRAR